MFRFIRSPFIILIVSLFIFVGCELGDKEKDTSQVLAEWDGGKITEKLLNERLNLIPDFYKPRGGFTVEQKQKYLNDYAIEEIFYIEALSENIDATENAKEFYIQNAKRIILDQYVQEQIKDEIKPTENNLKKFYENNKNELYKKSPTATLLYIETQTKENSDKAYAELLEGAEFTEVMNKYSTNENLKKKGGKITNVRKGGYIPNVGRSEELDSLIFNAEIDDIIPPVKLNNAYHIVKIADKDTRIIRPYEDVIKDVENRYSSEKEQELRLQLIDKLMKKYNVAIDSAAVKAVDYSQADTSLTAGAVVLISSSNPDIVFTAKDFAEEVRMLPDQRKQTIQDEKGKLDFITAKVQDELLYIDALKKGYENHPKIKDQLRRAKMIGTLREYYQQYVVDEATVSEDDIRAAYEKDKEQRYVIKPHVEIQEFSFEDKNFATTVYEQAKEAQTEEALNTLVREHCVRTKNNGIIGPIYEGGIIPGVGKDDIYLELVFSTQEDEFSNIFEDAKGNWVFFRVLQYYPKSYRELEIVRNELETNLQRQAQKDLFEKLTSEMKEKYNLKVYAENLEEKLSADSLFTLAEEAMTEKNYARAIYFYDKIIDQHANGQYDYKAKFMKGFIYSEYLNNNDRALELFEEVLTYPREGVVTDTTLHPSARYMIKSLKGEEDILEKINQQPKND